MEAKECTCKADLLHVTQCEAPPGSQGSALGTLGDELMQIDSTD